MPAHRVAYGHLWSKNESQKMNPTVHDSNIYLVLHDCENRKIVFGATSEDKKEIKIQFNGVLAHRFEAMLEGNIIFGIDECKIEEIVHKDWPIFEKGKEYGWPKVEFKSDIELNAKLNFEKYKGYQITSSYGLSGWVIAKEIEFSESSGKIKIAA